MKMKHLLFGIDALPHRVVESNWKRLHNMRGFFGDKKPPIVITRFPSVSEYTIDPCFGMKSNSYIAGSEFSREKQRIVFSPGLAFSAKKSKFVYSKFDSDHNIFSYGLTYFVPNCIINKEIEKLKVMVKEAMKSKKERTILFLSYSDPLFHVFGDAGLKDLLLRIDKEIFPLIDPKCNVTIFSDHSMTVPIKKRMKNVCVEKTLKEHGFRIRKLKLTRENDVLAIRPGLISSSILHCHKSTKDSARQKILDISTGVEGVELAACLLKDKSIIAANRHGKVRITKKGNRFCCERLEGKPVLGRVEGAHTAKELLHSTADHEFPDAVYRLCDAFHNVANPADVLVSLKRGYVAGNALLNLIFNKMKSFISTHGSISKECAYTVGFSTKKKLTEPFCMKKKGKKYMRISDFKLC
jgi:hypothetical protein